MKFNRIPSVLILMLLTLSIGVFSEVSEEQKKLLESLPPDQRTTVMNKMEAANALEEDLEETFENPQNLIERPNYEDLANLKRDLESECDDCIFGYDFFKYAPTTFAPINNIPVSSDYILGPGDKLQVNLYGNETDKFQSFISREGSFFLPPLGPVNLSGLTFVEASELIKQRVKNELIGTNASVSLSEIRSIYVYMLGEVYQPGKYTMSGLSSLFNALIVSGGVNENGSLRNIQVKRDDLIVANYDFYEFLLQGSLENDIKLLDGDVIFVPFIEDRVRIGGAFKRPGIYEIKKGETVKDVINLAGGFESDVPKNSEIELSFYDELSSSRKFSSLKPGEFNRKVYGESSINVSSQIGYKVETIKLSGEFNNPGEYAIRPNDTLLDVIKRAGGYGKDGYSDGGVFLRKSVAKLQKQAFLRSADDLENTIADIITRGTLDDISEFTLSPISRLISRLRAEEPLGRVVMNLDFLSLKNNPSINFRIQDGDELFIPRRPNSISVVGEVLSASTSGFDPSKNVFDYIEVAGGMKTSADSDKIFVILPDGSSSLVKKSLFSSNNLLIPGSTIVVSRDPRPFDAINLTSIITPILADLATSAAAIAAISD